MNVIDKMKKQDLNMPVQLVVNQIPRDYKNRLKAFAAKHGMSMADAITVAVEVLESYEKQSK